MTVKGRSETPTPHRPKAKTAHRGRWVLVQQSGAAIGAAGLGALVSVLFVPGALESCLWVGPLAVLIAGVLTVLVAVGRLTRYGHENGTLYYVRHQFPGMADWHTAELEELVDKDPLDFRVLTREITQPLSQSETLDCAEEIRELAIAFENQTNVDDASTGFTLAPDLQWFSALAFGSQLYARWDHQQLHELATTPPGQATSSRTFTWDLRQPPEHGVYRDVRIVRQDLDQAAPDAAVLVSANLTSPSPQAPPPRFLSCRPTQWRLARWYGVGSFPAERVTYETPYDHVQASRSGAGFVDPWIATARCVQAIRLAAYENPGRPILVSLAVPKTVAVAIGWHLLRDEIGSTGQAHLGLVPLRTTGAGPVYRDTRPGSANLWANIVPLYFGAGFHPVRVHSAQPSAEAIQQRLTQCLLPAGTAPPPPVFPAAPND